MPDLENSPVRVVLTRNISIQSRVGFGDRMNGTDYLSDIFFLKAILQYLFLAY